MKEIKQLVALLTMNSSVVYEYTASGIKRIDNGTKYERFISPSLSDSVTFIVTASLADIIQQKIRLRTFTCSVHSYINL